MELIAFGIYDFELGVHQISHVLFNLNIISMKFSCWCGPEHFDLVSVHFSVTI
jgi:hypothetical protein